MELVNGLDDESMLLCLSNRTLPLPPSCSLTLKRKGEANLNFRGERREERTKGRGKEITGMGTGGGGYSKNWI